MNALVKRSDLEQFAELLAEASRRKARKRQAKRGGLIEFVRHFWHVLEPNTPLVEGKALEAICRHLEAVTFGEITRLLINVPPGFMKSLLTDVFWPAWEWGPMSLPHLRYVSFSYAASLTLRDNGRFRDLILSPEYRELWGDKFTPKKIGEEKVTNNKTGWKLASSVGGVATGERGNRVILDDPHSVKESESEVVRGETVRWFKEAMSNRLNDMERDAIVIIMQRVHSDDVSGTIIAGEMEYVHLCIPMEFDPLRSIENEIGWIDWRTEEGELAWPERFPARVVDSLRRDLGPYAYAGQCQQWPTPRGGAILKEDYWQLWEDEEEDDLGGKKSKGYPQFDFVLASTDTAYTKDEINDPSALVILGVFREGRHGFPRVMLCWAWSKRCELHGVKLEKKPGETKKQYDIRSMPTWGLVEWIGYSCRRFQVDKLLIENKASGKSVATEMRRLYSQDGWAVHLVDPRGDKVARAHAVEPMFAAGLVYAPDTDWAQKVIDQCMKFPKDKHDDLVDALTQGLRWLRDNGLISHNFELEAEDREARMYRPDPKPLYDA